MILRKTALKAGVGIACLASVFLYGGAAFAQSETVIIKRPAQLRDAPGESARAIAALPVQTPVTRLGDRSGAWIKVGLADGSNGWVHMFDITSANNTGTSTGANALRTLGSFFNKSNAQPQGAMMATSTVGIRGLGATDLANAQPNIAAVAMADASRVDAQQAQRFAALSSLSARQIEPLPAPTSPPTQPSGSPGMTAPDQYSR